MKISNTLFTLLLSVIGQLVFSLHGQEPPKQNLQLVKVASLNTIEANKEFQKNVQLVQQQRALAVQILSKMQSSQDKDEHDNLKKQLDSLQKKLNENNNLMFKTYGFSLNRNYVLTVEKAHVHMWVTEEEAQAIKAKNQTGKSVEDIAPEKSGFRSLFKKSK
jgi:flagellar biosynthesis component FlhA